jgi:hypothetical protein
MEDRLEKFQTGEDEGLIFLMSLFPSIKKSDDIKKIKQNGLLEQQISKNRSQSLDTVPTPSHKINKDLYQLHLHNANTWNTWWLHIEHQINRKLQHEMRKTFKNKIKNLKHRKLQNTDHTLTTASSNLEY